MPPIAYIRWKYRIESQLLFFKIIIMNFRLSLFLVFAICFFFRYLCFAAITFATFAVCYPCGVRIRIILSLVVSSSVQVAFTLGRERGLYTISLVWIQIKTSLWCQSSFSLPSHWSKHEAVRVAVALRDISFHIPVWTVCKYGRTFSTMNRDCHRDGVDTPLGGT